MQRYFEPEGKEPDYIHPFLTYSTVYKEDLSPHLIFIDRYYTHRRDGSIQLLPEVFSEEVVNRRFVEHVYIQSELSIKEFLQHQLECYLARTEETGTPEEFHAYLFKLIQRENHSIAPYETDHNRAFFSWFTSHGFNTEGLVQDRFRHTLIPNTIPASHSKTHTSLVKAKLFTIRADVSQQLYIILKDFFNPGNQAELKKILAEGINSQFKLLFLDNGNRLADAFRRLKESDLIVGCSKKDLQEWLVRNFSYTSSRGIKEYTEDYAEKCISRNYFMCKRPLFKVVDGNLVQGS